MLARTRTASADSEQRSPVSPRLQVPTLILVGDEDTPVLKSSDFLARALARAYLISFPQTGHTLNLEEPGRFNAAVREFLEGLT
jgi:pimeloyl-ACP methyl ester carboxylesterase